MDSLLDDFDDLENMDEEAVRREMERVEQELAQIPKEEVDAATKTEMKTLNKFEQNVQSMDAWQVEAEIARVSTELNLATHPTAAQLDELLASSDPDGSDLYCLCRRKGESILHMIKCDFCPSWYHLVCVSLTTGEADCIDHYACLRCRLKNPSLKTKYKTRDEMQKALLKEIASMDLTATANEIKRVKQDISDLQSVRNFRKEQAKQLAYQEEVAAAAEQKRNPAPPPARVRNGAGAGAAADPAGRDMTLLRTVRRVMRERDMSELEVAAASGVQDGLMTLTEWLKGEHKLPKLAEKEAALREWVSIYTEVPRAPVSKKRKSPAAAASSSSSPSGALRDGRAGDKIDAQDSMGQWYSATIKSVEGTEALVHNNRWNSKYDEWIDFSSNRLYPAGTFTSGGGATSSVAPGGAGGGGGGAGAADRKKRSKADTDGKEKKGGRRGKAQARAPKSVPQPKKKDNNMSVCAICNTGGSLLCCDGCVASYHGHCFSPPIIVDELPDEWYCFDCEDKYKRVPVWIPGKTGVMRGKTAPFKKDLKKWLAANPGYQVWRAGALPVPSGDQDHETESDE